MYILKKLKIEKIIIITQQIYLFFSIGLNFNRLI
jgi:hypothetical protein